MNGENRTGRMDGVIDGSVFSMIVGNTQYLICCHWLCVLMVIHCASLIARLDGQLLMSTN